MLTALTFTAKSTSATYCTSPTRDVEVHGLVVGPITATSRVCFQSCVTRSLGGAKRWKIETYKAWLHNKADSSLRSRYAEARKSAALGRISDINWIPITGKQTKCSGKLFGVFLAKKYHAARSIKDKNGVLLMLQVSASPCPWTTEASTRERLQFGALN